MQYPEWFAWFPAQPRKALVAAYDLAAIHAGEFLERCDSAAKKRSPREARECCRAALSLAGWPTADAQAIAGACPFEDWQRNSTDEAEKERADNAAASGGQGG